jgi:hypothetical protein
MGKRRKRIEQVGKRKEREGEREEKGRGKGRGREGKEGKVRKKK